MFPGPDVPGRKIGDFGNDLVEHGGRRRRAETENRGSNPSQSAAAGTAAEGAGLDQRVGQPDGGGRRSVNAVHHGHVGQQRLETQFFKRASLQLEGSTLKKLLELQLR